MGKIHQSKARKTIFDIWDITPEYFSTIINDNPSLRGMNLGYIAERKLRDIFDADERATATRKDDDHDRKTKSDLVVTYRGYEFRVEVKSLQTNSVEILNEDKSSKRNQEKWVKKIIKQQNKYIPNQVYMEIWEKQRLSVQYRGKVQCDASDRREILLPNGLTVNTTNLAIDEFDILAIGLFAFREKWDFGFALNRKLPRSSYKKYSSEIQQFLLATLIPVTWPIEKPFVSDPFILLDQLVREKQRRKS